MAVVAVVVVAAVVADDAVVDDGDAVMAADWVTVLEELALHYCCGREVDQARDWLAASLEHVTNEDECFEMGDLHVLAWSAPVKLSLWI